jgi:hypothetical protein
VGFAGRVRLHERRRARRDRSCSSSRLTGHRSAGRDPEFRRLGRPTVHRSAAAPQPERCEHVRGRPPPPGLAATRRLTAAVSRRPANPVTAECAARCMPPHGEKPPRATPRPSSVAGAGHHSLCLGPGEGISMPARPARLCPRCRRPITGPRCRGCYLTRQRVANSRRAAPPSRDTTGSGVRSVTRSSRLIRRAACAAHRRVWRTTGLSHAAP